MACFPRLLTKTLYACIFFIYILRGVVVFRNVLTIDVEDWYHVCGVELQQPVAREHYRVRLATERILAFLREHDARATFFVLGSVVADEPELVRTIAAEGHEIASHGWSHTLLNRLTPGQFRQELIRTEEALQHCCGVVPIGFRAPQWSVSDATPWVHEILAERGYWYDSSLNPLPLIGNRQGSRIPYAIQGSAAELWEFPPLVSPTPFGNMPTGGGWGFRFFPLGLIEHSIERLNASGAPAVLYLHPRDVDPDGPRLQLPLVKGFASYGTRSDALPRVQRLFETYRFTTLKELVSACRTVS